MPQLNQYCVSTNDFLPIRHSAVIVGPVIAGLPFACKRTLVDKCCQFAVDILIL